MKISKKISYLFLVTSTIFIIAVTTFFYITAKSVLKERILNHLITTVESRAQTIELTLQHYQEDALVLTVGNAAKNAVDITKDYAQGVEQVNKRIKSTLQISPDISEIRVLGKNGIVIASSHKDTGVDKSAQVIFLKGKNGVHIQDMHISELTGDIVVGVAAPIFVNDEFAGVLAINFDEKKLFKITTNRFGLGETGEIYLINKDGYMITPSRFAEGTFLKQKVDTENTRRAFEDIEEFGQEAHLHEAFVYRNYQGKKVLGIHAHIPQMQWTVLAEIDASEAFAPLRRLRWIFIAIICLVPVAAGFVGRVISGIITEPIHKLHKGTEIIAEGNLDYKVGTNAQDEIGQLSRAFDEMTESLKKSTTSINKLNNEIDSRKQAQEKTQHLTMVLRAISNVNQLIVQEKNPDTLIRKACEELVKFRGYKYAWIVIMNKSGKFIRAAQADAGGNFLQFTEDIKKGKMPQCVHRGLKEHFFIIEKPEDVCEDCGLFNIHRNKRAMVCSLEHQGEFYGVFSVAVSAETELDITERDLFKEVASDLALALHHMEIEAENKQAAEVIKRSVEEWKETFNSISDLVFIQNKDFEIMKCNKAFMDVLGLKEKDIIGKKCYELLHKSDKPWENCPLKQTKKDHKPHTEEVDDPKIGVPLLITTSPIFDNNGEYIGSVHIAKDISNIREAQKKMIEAIEIKSQFISMVSHELRTPLTAIKEGIGIVYDEITGELNEEQKDFLDTAKRNVERLSRLINTVLDFQKLQAGKMVFEMEENDINSIVDEASKEMKPLFEKKKLKLEFSLDKSLPKAVFDRDKITQVLTNLMNNALKFTERGSISITTQKEDKAIKVSVADMGSGIKEEDMKNLFHRFEQVSKGSERKTGGTGLGLAISKEIINAHKGRIWVESEFGKGATFSFTISLELNRRKI